MSRYGFIRAVASSSKVQITPRSISHIPPEGASRSQCRTFLTKRSKSFWSPSYPPPDHAESPQVPFTPPRPSSDHFPIVAAGPDAKSAPHILYADSEEPMTKTRDRKQRYLDSLMDRAGELSLRCSILDAEGNWTAEEGRYKKSELCKDYDLDPRDLRKLDSLTPNLVPIILTRRTCTLISMLHIRALIKPERVIVFDTAGTVESEVQRRFKWHLEKNIKAGVKTVDVDGDDDVGLPYEHRALESILVATANALEEEMGFTRHLVQQLLADLEDDINRDNLKRLLHYSRRMVGFQSRARYVMKAVDEVLESDEDLSAMYLTSKAQGRPRALHDHEQLELLLESFTKQVEEIVSEVDTTVANMQSTQEIAELMLDSGRNALLALDVKISIATLGVGTGALIAGVFGMNLTTHLESHPYAFWIAVGGAGTITAIICLVGLRILRRIRRVALSGPGSSPSARLMSSQAWDAALATLVHGPPNYRHIAPTPTPTPLPRALWNKIVWRSKPSRGRTPSAPLWINKQADLARVRDAARYQEIMDQETRRSKVQGAGYGDWKELERAWKGQGNCFGPNSWETGWTNKGKKSTWLKE